MGFNISGIAINKNFKNDMDKLASAFGWKLNLSGEINFETASSNWTEEGICNAYFTEHGTLLFINMDLCIEAFSMEDCNCLTFALSEISMAFNINYCEGKKTVRSIMEVEDRRMVDSGEKMEVENSAEDTSDIIMKQIEVVLGKSFWSIEPDENATQYLFV